MGKEREGVARCLAAGQVLAGMIYRGDFSTPRLFVNAGRRDFVPQQRGCRDGA
jgi:hypothetical protein